MVTNCWEANGACGLDSISFDVSSVDWHTCGLTRVPLERSQRLFRGLLARSLLVSELPPAPQLEADELPEEPRLGQTHQQQDSHPE